MGNNTDWGSVAIAAAVIYGIYTLRDWFGPSSNNIGGSPSLSKSEVHEIYRESLNETYIDSQERITGKSLNKSGRYNKLSKSVPFTSDGGIFGSKAVGMPTDTTDKSFKLTASGQKSISIPEAQSKSIFGNVVIGSTTISQGIKGFSGSSKSSSNKVPPNNTFPKSSKKAPNKSKTIGGITVTSIA